MKYYLITYMWERSDAKDVISMELWKGTVGEWMIARVGEYEHWRLINAAEIDKDEYIALEGYVEKRG